MSMHFNAGGAAGGGAAAAAGAAEAQAGALHAVDVAVGC